MKENKKSKDILMFEALVMIAVQASVYNEQIANKLQELCNMINENENQNFSRY